MVLRLMAKVKNVEFRHQVGRIINSPPLLHAFSLISGRWWWRYRWWCIETVVAFREGSSHDDMVVVIELTEWFLVAERISRSARTEFIGCCKSLQSSTCGSTLLSPLDKKKRAKSNRTVQESSLDAEKVQSLSEEKIAPATFDKNCDGVQKDDVALVKCLDVRS